MDQRLTIAIVISAENQTRAAAWSDMLRGDFASIWTAPTAAPPSAAAGILITDSHAPLNDMAGSWEKADGYHLPERPAGGHRRAALVEAQIEPVPVFPPPLASGQPRFGPLVVRIGGDAPADVHLPQDFAPRELVTACRLLAHIAELQAQLSHRDQQQHYLREQALSDPLTGLPNRRAWDEVLQAQWAGPPGNERNFCLAIVDLDHFKAINDAHGHLVGDAVLCATGKALRASLRQPDLVARLGGDEFGLLLEVPSATVAGIVVERARKSVAAEAVRSGLPRVTASLGYCTILSGSPPALSDPEAYVAAADAALRLAKQQGRDQTAAGTGSCLSGQ